MRSIKDVIRKTNYKENQMEFFLAECWTDFLFFAENVLGFEIADYHKEWYELLETHPRLCLIAFRGSGKTNFLAGYYIWKAIFNKNLNFLILSHTFEQSKIVLKLIRRMISDNELLKQFVPIGKEAIWKATELTLKTGAVFYCRTYGEGVKGLRIDYALCDEAGQYEDKSIFWTAVSPVVQLNRGKIHVTGTPESSIDLLAELKQNSEYMCKEYPAELNGKALWPQKYTTIEHDTATQRSLIKVRKELGDLSYTQEYLLIPISSANSLFPYELTLKSLMETEKFLPFGRKEERYYIGYDLALSPKGDYTVMIVLGVTNERKRIVKAVRFREDTNFQLEQLRKLVNDFHPVKICVDATGLGEDHAKRLSQEFPNIEAVKITYDEKYKMVLDLRREFENYNLIIPNSKEDMSYQFSQELLTELNEFSLKIDIRVGQTTRPKFHSGKYDDCVIALALANKATISPFGSISISEISF